MTSPTWIAEPVAATPEPDVVEVPEVPEEVPEVPDGLAVPPLDWVDAALPHALSVNAATATTAAVRPLRALRVRTVRSWVRPSDDVFAVN